MSDAGKAHPWAEAMRTRRRLERSFFGEAGPPPAFFDPKAGAYRVVNPFEERPDWPDGD